jgi:hypothetical protein
MDNKTIKILETIDIEESNNQNPILNKQKLLNLFELTKKNNIELFDDKKGKIKSKRKIIEECKSSRSQKIEKFVKILDEKKNINKSTSKIKILNDNFLNELESIENIVKYVNDQDFKILKEISESNDNKTKKNTNTSDDNFIEIFSNDN